jgi:methylated-DNA-[protein]-cysteine S-methyltransferase
LLGLAKLDPDQRHPLIALHRTYGADVYPVACGRLANLAPVSGREQEVHQQHGCEDHGDEDEQDFLQCLTPQGIGNALLWAIAPILSTFTRRFTALCYGERQGVFQEMNTLACTRFESPVGPLFLASSGRGLVALEFDQRLPGQQTIRPNPRDLRAESKSVRFEESAGEMQGYVDELQQYFAGERRRFEFPLDLRGTAFQLQCWKALLEIPYGETRTYADIARAVARPQGFRAVGMANNRNPIAIVVPCHRVIASDGTLCGYGGGLEIKRKLLELEGALTGTLAA